MPPWSNRHFQRKKPRNSNNYNSNKNQQNQLPELKLFSSAHFRCYIDFKKHFRWGENFYGLDVSREIAFNFAFDRIRRLLANNATFFSELLTKTTFFLSFIKRHLYDVVLIARSHFLFLFSLFFVFVCVFFFLHRMKNHNL